MITTRERTDLSALADRVSEIEMTSVAVVTELKLLRSMLETEFSEQRQFRNRVTYGGLFLAALVALEALGFDTSVAR